MNQSRKTSETAPATFYHYFISQTRFLLLLNMYIFIFSKDERFNVFRKSERPVNAATVVPSVAP